MILILFYSDIYSYVLDVDSLLQIFQTNPEGMFPSLLYVNLQPVVV